MTPSGQTAGPSARVFPLGGPPAQDDAADAAIELRSIVPQELSAQVHELNRFVQELDPESDRAYELLESRLDGIRLLTARLERQGVVNSSNSESLRDWFKAQVAPWLMQSRLMHRATTWPEGYPGDFVTLESVYAREASGQGLARLVDQYFLSRTLAVAVRSRRNELAKILEERARIEGGAGRWLNIACGPCRELTLILDRAAASVVYCVDSDPNALKHAASLLERGTNWYFEFIEENAFRFVNAKRTVQRYGSLSTIYSAGLFDYIATDKLVPIIAALYEALAPGGALIAPFKDRDHYETFDYHWLAKWTYFYQRRKVEFDEVFRLADVPESAIKVTRDESGVLLFYVITKPEGK